MISTGVVLCLLCSSVRGAGLGDDPHQLAYDMRLMADLFDISHYDRDLMPLSKPDDRVIITLNASLFQILDVDQRRQVVDLSVWFRFYWKDPHLIWNTTQYGGIDQLLVNAYRIWIPDVVVYNSVAVENIGTNVFADTPLQVSHTGQVSWLTLSVLQVSCIMHVYYFPFDIQLCSVQLGSWTQKSERIQLYVTNSVLELKNYQQNGEWDIIETTAFVRNLSVSGAKSTYQQAVFTITMQRKPLYYLVKFVLPGSLLVFLGVLAFILPSDTGDKIALHTTILLTIVVFQLMTSDSLPATSEAVPLLTQYFASCVIILTLSTALSVLSLTLCTSNWIMLGERAPTYMRILAFQYLAKILPLGPGTREALSIVTSSSFMNYNHKKTDIKDQDSDIFREMWNTRKDPNNKISKETTYENLLIPVNLQTKMAHFFSTYTYKKAMKDHKYEIQLEWKVISAVIDRFLFVIFAIISLVTSSVIFFQRYNVNKPIFHDPV